MTTTDHLGPSGVVLPALVFADALADPRVVRAVRLASRDAWMRARFTHLRDSGLKVDQVVARLLGPYEDDSGQSYYLSEERVRAIVYQK
ncbi:MAG: hypothetical protein AAFQ53_10015 [Bacteroidota bacterium]